MIVRQNQTLSQRPLAKAPIRAASQSPSAERPQPDSKAGASAPQSLIDRQLVAAALDRRNAHGDEIPDGLVAESEWMAAGITEMAPEAVLAINALGERGNMITVNELATALSQDQVMITGDGQVKLADGKARLENGELMLSGAWQFPRVADFEALQQLHKLVPDAERYNDRSPGSEFTYEVLDHYDHVYVGTERVQDGYDSNGNPIYRDEDRYEDRPVYRTEIDDSKLHDALKPLVAQAAKLLEGAQDADIKATSQDLAKALQASESAKWDSDKNKILFAALDRACKFHVPQSPEAIALGLHTALNGAAQQVDEQRRIAANYPVDQVEQAAAAELKRLRGFTQENLVSGIAGVIAGGFLGVMMAGPMALSGLALHAATAGMSLIGAGIAGWWLGKRVKKKKIATVETDLGAFKQVSPTANRRELEGQAFASYKLLQDARSVKTLSDLNAYETQAKSIQDSVAAVAKRAKQQAQSFKNLEALILKYRAKRT